ncbi:MAG: carboxylesterase family protein [Flavobacteriales bacterium]
MKATFCATLFVLLLSATRAWAQDCSIPFTTPLFDVREELNIYYGTATRYNGVVEDLRLNLFKPIGDGQPERPLIILIHGGGFTGGHRNDLNQTCRDLAAMGWVTATISYRLDFYGTWLLGSPFSYDPAEVIRAAYRAQQDTRGALRFLKARSATDSTSLDNIVLMGYSAGAIAALHAALVDEPSEKPAACGAIGNVNHLLSSYARPDLGPFQGTLNINGQNDDVLAVASNYGGLLDTNLISGPLDPALYLYHQTGDPVVGCGYRKGLWGMPLGVGDNYPYLYGSCVTDDHITQNIQPDPSRYMYHEHVGNAHEVHAPAAIMQETLLFLRELFCSPVANVQLTLRLTLEGPYDSSTGLMSDGLRNLGLVPTQEPYAGLGYIHVGGGAESTSPAVLAQSGSNAIVDWVVVELRDPAEPTLVLESRSALLQRDGDVVAVDGTSPLNFSLPPGNYHVAVMHRNHLGVMTNVALNFSNGPAVLDLRSAGTPVFGTDGRVTLSGTVPALALWAGDVSFDGELKYTGAINDRDPILEAIGGNVATNTTSGYLQSDVNMDGTAKYTGSSNDRDIILQNIGGVVPTNTRVQQMP